MASSLSLCLTEVAFFGADHSVGYVCNVSFGQKSVDFLRPEGFSGFLAG